MVGGTVIGRTRLNDGNTRITVGGTGHDRGVETTRVVEGQPDVMPGDSVWWQCDSLMWTPAGNKPVGPGQGERWDIVLQLLRYER